MRQHVTSRPLLGADQLAMTVAVKAEAAANGRINAGDLVAVLVTTEKGRPTTQSSLVLERVLVLDIGYDERLRSYSSGASDAGEREQAGPLASVTLALSREQALQLARAKHNGELDVALLGGGR